MKQKGIVLTHQMDPKGLFSGKIDPSELRKHLLYWDFIDFPLVFLKGSNVKIGTNFDFDEDVKLLTQQKIIKHTEVEIDSEGSPGHIILGEKLMGDMLKGQYKLVEQYKNNNVDCSMAQYNVRLKVPVDLQKEMNAIDMEFTKFLPYPARDTRIVDILEFKLRRGDELLNLREAMDEFYSSISGNADNVRIRELAIRKLSRAVNDIDLVLAERKSIMVSRFNFRVLLKFPLDLLGGYFMGVEIANRIGFPEFPIGISLGIGSTLIHGNVKKILGPKILSDSTKDFAYLYSAGKELKMSSTRTPRKD